MSIKSTVNLPSRGAALPAAAAWQTQPWTTEEFLQQIEAMGQRINRYVQFMCSIGSLNGSSGEAKQKAITAFYERLTVLERQLVRIQDDLQLG
jgi:hypothetical protein